MLRFARLVEPSVGGRESDEEEDEKNDLGAVVDCSEDLDGLKSVRERKTRQNESGSEMSWRFIRLTSGFEEEKVVSIVTWLWS